MLSRNLRVRIFQVEELAGDIEDFAAAFETGLAQMGAGGMDQFVGKGAGHLRHDLVGRYAPRQQALSPEDFLVTQLFGLFAKGADGGYGIQGTQPAHELVDLAPTGCRKKPPQR